MPIDLRHFGRYYLTRRVSLGGMAEVFKAKCYIDGRLEKIVALKRLLPNVAEDQQFIDMFLQEAQLAARLEHPNICRIYELGKVGVSYYITMEYLYGRDLRAVLKALKKTGRDIDPRIAAWIGAQVAEGLAYAYRRDDEEGEPMHLVHRDISPQNIMIGFDGSVKIIDFGIAKVANATVQTDVGILKGKYSYMSPEHADRQTLDARSDIWSLGVVLHELLRCKRLFIGKSMADTIDQVLHLPIPALTDVPPQLAETVHSMLQRDRDVRPANHRMVQEHFDAYLATESAPVNDEIMAQWMDNIFPDAARVEEDLTDNEVKSLLYSAEELGDETTDMRGEVTSATEIFLADTTNQGDYRAALERLISTHTTEENTESSPITTKAKGTEKDPREAMDDVTIGRDAWTALSAILLVTWLLLFL
jgi:serine/threonine protein kinase